MGGLRRIQAETLRRQFGSAFVTLLDRNSDEG
jgi:hypothetical protein